MTATTRTLLTLTSAANLLQTVLFPVLAVRALGAGAEADALFMVFVLVNVVGVLLANSVLNWVTPRLVMRSGALSRRQLAWSLVWVLLLAVAALCALLWLLAALAVAGREPADAYHLAAGILPLGLLAMLAAVVAAIAQCVFVAERDVLGGEWRSLLGSSVALAAWFAFAPQSLAACAALFLLRTLLVTLALLPRLGRPRALVADDRDLREILRESRVLLLAATYYKSEPFIDRLLFASAPGGAVAAYHLASQVLGVVTQLAQRVLVAPVIAPFAEAVQRADLPAMRRLIGRTLLRTLAVGVLIWALVIAAGGELVALLLAGSGVAPADVALAADMMALLGGYMLAVLMGIVSAQVYYCCGETRRVAIYSTVVVTLGVPVKLIGLWQFGVLGLVAGISLSWLMNVAWFWWKVPAIFADVARRPRD